MPVIDCNSLTMSSDDSSFQALVTYPAKPNAGRLGRSIDLETNHFILQLPINTGLYHYSISLVLIGKKKTVDITNSAPGLTSFECRAICIAVYKMLFEKEPHRQIFNNRFACAYDGRSNIYALIRFCLGPENTYRTFVEMADGTRVEVVVQPCQPFQLNVRSIIQSLATHSNDFDRSALQALDVITSAQMILKNDYYNFGSLFYKPADKRLHIGHGFELYEGFFKSLRPIKGLTDAPFIVSLNIESKKAPFYAEGPLLSSVMDELQLNQVPKHCLRDVDILKLRRRFKGIKVCATHTKHSFRITDIMRDTAMTTSFQKSENSTMTTVCQYFIDRYQVKLRYPHLPLVTKGRCYYPMELLVIIGGQRVGLTHITESCQREIVTNTAVPPYVRRLDILKTSSQIGLHGKDNFARVFGISFRPEMMKLTGRVLSNPVVQYSSVGQNRGEVSVSNGVWDMRSQGVYLSANIKRWAVVNMSPDLSKRNVDEFLNRLTIKAGQMGVKMEKNYVNYAQFMPNELSKLTTYFEMLVRVDGVTYVICIMPETRDDVRNHIKFVGEVSLGLVTQCLRKKTVLKGLCERGVETLYLQLMLKANAKNGGVNNEVKPTGVVAKKWLRKGVMFVGLDVNHPPALSRAEIEMNKLPTEPSVVGAVCNSGKTVSDYRMKYKLQDARKESIDHCVIEDVMKAFLKEYEENNKQLPSSVIVYRDGVADNQFRMVVETELRYLTESFWHYKQNYSPKLTLIVVQKRHHTRFFRTNLKPEDKCSVQNIPPGTVVDRGPVNPVLFDFFLCSHVGIQGTSKPAQYTVLYDENGFDADSIQTLSYLLCQTYQKCNRSVSIPAPVYHAHHAATRGKELFLAINDCRNATASFGSPTFTMPLKEMETKINVHDKVRRRMFWM